MGPTRRTFMASAAALPAIATIGSAPSIASAAPRPPPRPEYPFRWWYSDCGDIYHHEFDTREQALDFLKDVGRGLISECQQQDFDLSVDGDQVLEMLLGQNEELIGESEFIEPKAEQLRELGEMVSVAIDQWVRKNNICTTAWAFRQVRNTVKAEYVPSAQS